MSRVAERTFHRALYFGLQILRRRPVHSHIETLQRWATLDHSKFRALMRERLDEMLRYAVANVPLYSSGPWRERLAGHVVTDLDAWPILERSTVRTESQRLLAQLRVPGRFYRSSSASTGEPLRVAWDPSGAAWGWANEYRALMWHGVAPGARTLLMWGSGRKIDCWVKNCRLFSTKELSAERLHEAAEYLLTEHPELCQGLPSALTRLAVFVRSHYPNAPASLVPYAKVGGEQVYPFQRELIHRDLGARVIETYGCTEVGPIAVECPAGSLHVLTENVHLEICRNTEPLPDGEHGDIVVTSLSNRAMPLIRCRIGDRASLHVNDCPCGRPQPILEGLIARSADVFVAADGKAVHGSALAFTSDGPIATALGAKIEQMLFVQLDQRHWRVLVESESGFDAATAAALAAHVRNTVGQGCEVEIERVAVVGREPSGKFRYYRLHRGTADAGASRGRAVGVM